MPRLTNLLSFRLPLRFLRGSYSRLALTVIALACGVALVCAIDLVNRAVLRAFVEVIDTMAGRAALQVSAGHDGLFPEEVAHTVAAVPGVELAVPVVSATAFTTDESGELLTVHGVEITNEAAVRVYDARDAGGLEIADPLVFLNRPDSIIITRAFAERRHLTVGAQLDLETPTGRRAFTVRGLLEAQGVARIHGGNLIVMDLLGAQTAFARSGYINRVDVVVGPGTDLAQARSAIAARLLDGLHVDEPAQRKADLQKVMQSAQLLVQGVGWVGLVAAFLIAYNRLETVFEERVGLLGIMRATGVRASLVGRELLKESLLLGLAGVALGIPLGIGLAKLLLPVIASTTTVSSKLITVEAELTLQPLSLALAVGVGVLSALSAATFPARRAARTAIAEVLRQREQSPPDSAGLWIAFAGLLAFTLAMGVVEHATHAPAWGIAASAAMVVCIAIGARLLLGRYLGRIFDGPSRMLGPAERFAVMTLTRSPRRSAMTVATLAVGFATVFWLWIVVQSFERSVLAMMPGIFRGDIAIASAHLGAGFVEAPIDEAILETLERVPGVTQVVGEQAIDWQYADGPIAIQAVDPPYLTNGAFGEWMLQGRSSADVWTSLVRGDGALISTNFALHLGARVGDTITLQTPSGPLPLQIGGMITTFLSPRGTVVMNRDVYKRHWHDPQITHALVRAASDADLTAVRGAIAAAVGKRFSVKVLSVGELIEWLAGQVRRAFGALYVLGGLVMVVVLVGVADTLGANVFERTRYYGVLRATGVGRGSLRRMVLTEGMVLGVCGLMLAGIGGLLLGTMWVEATFPHLLGWVLNLHVPYAHFAVMSSLSLVVCAIAALLPAERASRLDPAVALRYE